MLDNMPLDKKMNAVIRITDHALSYDLDTPGYVAINLTPPMNPCLIEYRRAQVISLSSIQKIVEDHVRSEWGKL